MGALIGFLGLAGLVVAVVLLVVRVFFKKGLGYKNIGVLAGVALTLFIVGLIITPSTKESFNAGREAGQQAVKNSSTVIDEVDGDEGMGENNIMAEYTIEQIEDLSFANVYRYTVKAVVEPGTTKQELAEIAREIAEDMRETKRYFALAIHFYDYPELIGDMAPLGQWIDAPYGDWSRADEAKYMDYSTHQEDDSELREKDWSKRPTQEEIDVYVMFRQEMNALWNEIDPEEPTAAPDEDQAIQALADVTGKSIEAVRSDLQKVNLWLSE